MSGIFSGMGTATVVQINPTCIVGANVQFRVTLCNLQGIEPSRIGFGVCAKNVKFEGLGTLPGEQIWTLNANNKCVVMTLEVDNVVTATITFDPPVVGGNGTCEAIAPQP